MNNKIGETMYTVTDLTGNPSNDQWEVRKGSRLLFNGKFKSVVLYCVNGLGFQLRDFDKAVSALAYSGHDVIEFDSSGKLLGTSMRGFIKTRKTG